MVYLLDSIGSKFFVGCLTEVFSKIREILNDDRIPVYQDKVEVLNLLSILGYSLDAVADLVNKYYLNDVMITVDNACKDRVAKVQQAARNAKEVWTALKDKGDELAEHKKTEEIGPNTALTPDDLIKVQSGFGNVADAKTLGYLKKAKSKSKKRPKTGSSALDHKRSKTKQLNSSQNKIESRMMREKIFNMEKERNDLLRQAEVFKKRDNSIENLMDKYRVKSDKKPNSKSRGQLLSKIKERMTNIEKGKSIEIIESKRGRDRRLQREQLCRDEDAENEGGESENEDAKKSKSEGKSNSAGKRSKGSNSNKDANSDKDQNSKRSHNSSAKGREDNEDEEGEGDLKEESDSGEQDQNLFNEEEEHSGDQKFNKPSESPEQKPKQDKEKVTDEKKTNELIPKALNKDLEKAAKGGKDEYGIILIFMYRLIN